MITNLPFTYSWLIKKSLDKAVMKTILELGCGKGDFGDLVNDPKKYEITGVDIFSPYLSICREKGRYTTVIKADLNKKLEFKGKSFDAVICLQTIEHLGREKSLSLLDQMEKIAKKLIIISTPLGECFQEEYDSNIHQRHLSTWDPEDFRKRGYRVYGVGLKLVYGSESHIKKEISIKKLPLYLLSFLMNPVANIFPNIGCQIIAVKVKNEKIFN